MPRRLGETPSAYSASLMLIFPLNSLMPNTLLYPGGHGFLRNLLELETLMDMMDLALGLLYYVRY